MSFSGRQTADADNELVRNTKGMHQLNSTRPTPDSGAAALTLTRSRRRLNHKRASRTPPVRSNWTLTTLWATATVRLR